MSGGDRGGRTIAGVLTLGASVLLWRVISVVFSTDRGLEFTDEGLYLLALDPPTNAAHWQSPFGWSTAPLFDLVGHDVARVRTAAIWLLVVLGAAVGAALARWLVPDDRTTGAMVAAAAALSAPLLVANFLRTPGYNWANLVGLLFGLGGVAVACRGDDQRPWHRDRRLHAAAALLALGIVVAVPAKPTSGPAILAAAALVVGVERGRRRLLHVIALACAWTAAFVALVVITGLWPTSFARVLWQSRNFPPLHPNQTLGGAFRDLLRSPRVAFRELHRLRPGSLALVGAATLAAVALHRRRSDNAPERNALLRCVPLVACALAAVGTAVPWPLLGLPNPQYRMAWTGTALAVLLLLYGAALHLLANARSADRAGVRRAIVVTAAAGLLVAAFGLGSAMGVFNQAAAAAVFVALAAAAVATALGDRVLRQVGAAVIAVSCLALIVSNTVDSRHHPYRNVDIALQTSPVTLGAHDGTLLVERRMADELDALRSGARAAGFCSGTRLIGMKWDWSATEPFALGAHVPDSLMLTIFGYPDPLPLLPVTMAELDDPRWHDAWVMTTDPATLRAADAALLRTALDLLPQHVDRAFPAAYVLEVDVEGTQLWRPADVTAAACD